MVKQILDDYKQKTVNSNRINTYTVNSKTVNEDKINKLLEELRLTVGAVAEKLAKELGDTDSLNYYITLANNNHPGRLLEALSYVKDAEIRGKITTKKAIYFQGILRNWGIQTKFKKS